MSKPVIVRFIGEASNLTGTVGQVEGRMGKLKGLIAGLGIGTLLFGEFKRATDAAAESNEVTRQTEARLKSTGAAAWISSQQVGALANALAQKTGIDDEAIQSNENLLLTFQHVRNEAGAGNDIFNQATKTILDMSVAFKESGQAASIQLGKALEDPIKGMTALSRIGITFTAQQKDQIKTLVDSGHQLEAQKVILAAVNSQVAGSAEAAATPYKKLQVTLGNLEENLGNKLIPIVNAASSFFNHHTGLVLGAAAALGILVGVVKAITVAEKAWAVAQRLINLAMASNPIGLVIVAVAGLIAVIVLAYRHSQTFRNIVQGAFRAVTGAASAAWDWIKGHWPLLLGVLTGPVGAAVIAIVRNWDRIRSGAANAFNAVVSFARSIPGRIRSAIGNLGSLLFQAGRNVIEGLINGIKSRISGVADTIANVAQTIRNHLPFSPAKEGPLSGKGSPELGGRNIVRMIATGIDTERDRLRRSMGGLFPPPGGAMLAAAGGGTSITVNARTNADAAEIAREVAWTMRTSGR